MPQTKAEMFAFERDTRHVFDEIYARYNLKVKRIIGPSNKLYDCLILWHGQWIAIEEKMRSHDYNDLLVEIEQDIETADPGWLYTTQARYLLYGTPKSMWCISIPRLRCLIKKERFPEKVSKKGWGRTRNIAIPWNVITSQKVGFLLP